MNAAIWWIRRDLRLADNQALNAALNHAKLVTAVSDLSSNSTFFDLVRGPFTPKEQG